MTNKPHSEPVVNEGAQLISSTEEGSNKDQSEILYDSDQSVRQTSYDSRKAALSKREIMEQISRERFPWDE